ncbi:MAG: RlmE family RNA methyltransferase [Myxococcales bacterium]|nr:RlmE family RNA methyltransferase [Myxococcales bacterium]
MTRAPKRAGRQRPNPYAKPDVYATRAKEAGYAARSVFKLEEIDHRLRLLKGGLHVLDLGAAPGSWSQYVCEKIGASGRLLAVDRSPLRVTLPRQGTFFQGDALTLGTELAQHAPYDVVLSDMAPDTMGHRQTDKIRSFELFDRALDVALALLKPGGVFVGKIFMGGQFPEVKEKVRHQFDTVRVLRPEAVRGVSYEVFVVGVGRKVAVPPSD